MRPTRLRRGVMSVVALGVAAVFLAPYVEMLLTSVKPQGELAQIPPSLVPSHWDFSSYLSMWKVAPMADYLLSSVVIAGGSTALCMCVAVPAAYCSARFDFAGKRVYLLAVLVTQMLAPVALVVGLYREFESLGLVNSYLALIIIDAAFNICFVIWLMRAFIASIPPSLEEAAWIDGCGRLQGLVRVVLPAVRPGLVTSGVYAFITGWNEFVVALTLISTESRKPIQVGLTEFMGQSAVDWEHLFAGSVISIVPVLIMFLLVQKHLIGGLTAGAVK